MVEKRLLVPDRIRCIPLAGFSWIDRRFVRAFAPSLTNPQILLYYFLASVADARGLSFWADPTAARLLGMPVGHVVGARDVLVARDLIAYRSPLYQVLALPESNAAVPASRRAAPAPAAGARTPPAAPPPRPAQRGGLLTGRAFVEAIEQLRTAFHAR